MMMNVRSVTEAVNTYVVTLMEGSPAVAMTNTHFHRMERIALVRHNHISAHAIWSAVCVIIQQIGTPAKSH